MPMMLLALVWGFAEATVFFIVPDVLLSLVALRRGLKPAATCALAATIGAALGGAVMYQWAAHDPQTVMRVLDDIPGISSAMVAATGREFASHGWPAMFAAPFVGVPYKLFASAAGESAASFPGLVALTIPARLPRFLLACVAAAVAGRLMRRSPRLAVTALAAFWVVFYIGYFAIHRE